MEKKHNDALEAGYKIVAKVISQKGTCGFGHQVGDTVAFDGETVEGRVCLSALYSLWRNSAAFCPRYLPCDTGPTSPGLRMTKTWPPTPALMPTTRWSLRYGGCGSRIGLPEATIDFTHKS